MKAENYLNVVEKLNNELYEADISEWEMGFTYVANNCIDIIEFMGIQVFYSENDYIAETEEQLEKLIREKILMMTNALCKWQNFNR